MFGDIATVKTVETGGVGAEAPSQGWEPLHPVLINPSIAITDVPRVAAALNHTRLRHLGCEVTTLIDDPHVTTAPDAEQAFWQYQDWQEPLSKCPDGCILVIGYAPSILLAVCQAIQQQAI